MSGFYRTARHQDRRVVDVVAITGGVFMLVGLYLTFGVGPALMGVGVGCLVVAWAWI